MILTSGDRALVFPGHNGQPWSEPAYQSWRRRAFKRALKAAGVEHARPYDLRHTRLTRWAATKPLPLVQKAAGHASVRTTMGYVHLSDDDLSALVEPTPNAKPREKTG